MKLFRTNQIRNIDSLTTKKESISSFQLMERAASAFFEKLLAELTYNQTICIVAGSGNNGGDALVIAGLLHKICQPIRVYLVNPKNSLSADCKTALDALLSVNVPVQNIKSAEELEINDNEIILDGLFGSGLNRPLSGVYAEIVQKINSHNAYVISIDIPSGLFGEDNSSNLYDNIIKATKTFTFQMPKLSFFLPENEKYVGDWEIVDIKLHPEALEETISNFYLTEKNDIKKILHRKEKFSHKGTFGHALLIAGSYGMLGAAVLAAKSALRSGCGLLTAHIPQRGYEIMQISLPEAIVSLDKNENHFSGCPDLSKYNAIGIGPGLGCDKESLSALKGILSTATLPLVLDADALNMLASESSSWNLIPSGTILTPHPKEFERLAGKSNSRYEQWMKQLDLSNKYKVIIVLKGAYSSISFPNGTLHINQTGNPGMATAGSGDTLTGIILSLLSQKYTPEEAAMLGVWIHGKAGDIAAKTISEESLIAGDITDNLGKAFLELKKEI